MSGRQQSNRQPFGISITASRAEEEKILDLLPICNRPKASSKCRDGFFYFFFRRGEAAAIPSH